MLANIRKALMVTVLSLVVSTTVNAADKKVAFVPQLIGIPYFNAMQAGGNRAAKDLGVDFIYSGPVDTNPVDQLQIVQNMIDQGVDAISISVLDASSIAPVVEAAKAKGVKLFTSDSDAPDSGRAVYVAQATDEGLGNTIVDELVKRVGEERADRGRTLFEISGEVLALSRNGLVRRRRFDPGGQDETRYLEPLEDLHDRGITPAEELLEKLNGPWQGSIVPIYKEYAY